MSSVEWVNDVVGHPVGDELNRMEAEQVTAKIKAYAGVAWVLLFEAHLRKAHKAMGYETWAEYVETEFDMSKSRSYQLISQAKIVLEISAAVSTDVDTGDPSTVVDISEATARDLAGHVDEAVAAAKDAADALGSAATAAERAKAAAAAVEQTRYDAVERARQRRAEEAAAAEAERLAAELEGQNGDGEVLNPGSEPREDHGGSDGAGASDDEGAGATTHDPAPSAPSLGSAAHPDDSYRARMSKEFAAVRNGLFLLSPDRMLEVSDLDRRADLEAIVRDLRSWCDDVDRYLTAKPRMEMVK